MGVSGMLVGTVMISEERAYVLRLKFGNQETFFEVHIKICSMLE